MNTPDANDRLEFSDLKSQYAALKQSIDLRIHRMLEPGEYIMGPMAKELESPLLATMGAKHCSSASRGTETLLISFMALDLRSGDGVVTTPLTFAATAEMIVLAGGKPVFADTEPDACKIDATKIEAAITLRTRAMVPASLYRQVADMDDIDAIAVRHGGIPVVEDAAQSFGAICRGKRSCSLGTVGCTNFYPRKPLGCYADGGAIFTGEDALAQVCREIRVHAQCGRYHRTRADLGGCMDTQQCEVVPGRLIRFEWDLCHRRAQDAQYETLLTNLLGVPLIAVRPERDFGWDQSTVSVSHRSDVQHAMTDPGIPIAVHCPRPLNMQPADAEHCCPHGFPENVGAGDSMMSLPMIADLAPGQQEHVASALRCAPVPWGARSVPRHNG